MKIFAPLTLAAVIILSGAGQSMAQASAAPPAIVQPSGLRKISPHVWVIPDNDAQLVANIGFVVGSKATLVVDTGMGPRNGEIVLKEAQRLSRGKPLYLVSTHVHPEHDLGAQAFPATTTFIRAEQQARDIAENGYALADAFRAQNALNADLLKDARFRAADITFDPAYNLDLGGVKVQLLAMGLNHTLGDTVVWVDGDRVLFSGDLAMKAAPSFNAKAGLRRWRATLNALVTFRPKIIVPSHGPVGDGQLINAYQFYFSEIQDRVAVLKGEGKTVDQTVATLSAALAERLPNAPARLGPVIRAAYAEAP